MSDYEEIRLAGGPADGRLMPWDGGDYVEVAERPPAKVLPSATVAFQELMITRHMYRRDPVERSVFRYVGDF